MDGWDIVLFLLGVAIGQVLAPLVILFIVTWWDR